MLKNYLKLVSLYIQNSLFDVIKLIPPCKIQNFIYRCDSCFHTSSVEELFVEAIDTYGIVIVKGEESSLYKIDCHLQPKFLSKVQTRLPGKTRRGGQSAPRIGRLRDEAIHRYLVSVDEEIVKQYTKDGVTKIKQLVLSGPGIKKEQLKDRLVLECPILLLTEMNIEDVVEKHGKTILQVEQKNEDDKHIKEIEDHLRVNVDRLVFGVDIHTEYKNNKLQTIYVTNKKSIKKMENKTGIIEIKNGWLDKYGGYIGLKWY